jgi:hypothetical protein
MIEISFNKNEKIEKSESNEIMQEIKYINMKEKQKYFILIEKSINNE